MLRRFSSIVLFVMLAVPFSAWAKSDKLFTYRYDVIWSTMIRFIRADLGYTIKDKDKEAGYILFSFPEPGTAKLCGASLEIISITDENGAKQVRVQLTIEQQPSYLEVHFLDRFEEKLRDEFGVPPPPEKEKKEKKEEPKEKKKPANPNA